MQRAPILPAAPIGYQYEYRIVKNEAECQALAIVQRGLKDGLSYRAIAAELNGRGFVNRRGNPYNASSVHNLNGPRPEVEAEA